MDAKALVNALIAEYAHRNSQGALNDTGYGDGWSAALIHAASVAYGYNDERATEFVAEQYQDVLAAIA